MIIREILWTEAVLEKIQSKHGVSLEEVEYVLAHQPHFRYVEHGRVKGEDLYQAWGRTAAGRYLVVFFLHKRGARALPISARSMTNKEKRFYARQKKEKS